MPELALQIITYAYAGVGVVAAFGYFPTIRDLWHYKQSANTHSYAIWTLSTFIALMYSLFILTDPLFRIVSGINFVCCSLILALSIALKQGSKEESK